MRKLVILFILLFCSNSVFGNAHFAYAGVDIFHNSTSLKHGYGSIIYPTANSNQLNLFIGYIFNKFVGLECGYERSTNKDNVVTIAPMMREFGINNFTSLVSNEYETKSYIYGFNLNYVPVININNSFAIVPILGAVYVHVDNNLNLQLFDGDPTTLLEQNNYNVHFSESKLVPRLGLRLQYAINRFVALRVFYAWTKTNLLQPKTTRNINTSQILQVKYNNTSSVGVGVSIKCYQ